MGHPVWLLWLGCLVGWVSHDYHCITLSFSNVLKRDTPGALQSDRVKCNAYNIGSRWTRALLQGPPGALCRALQGGPPTSHFYGSPHVFEVCSLCLGRIWTWIDFRQTVNKVSIRNCLENSCNVIKATVQLQILVLWDCFTLQGAMNPRLPSAR